MPARLIIITDVRVLKHFRKCAFLIKACAAPRGRYLWAQLHAFICAAEHLVSAYCVPGANLLQASMRKMSDTHQIFRPAGNTYAVIITQWPERVTWCILFMHSYTTGRLSCDL